MVKDLVKRGFAAVVSRQTNVLSAALFIILTTVLAQILGIVKYRLLVSFFGASNDLGVFFAAFKIPDFLFQIVIAGALSASFIPIFSDFLSKGKRDEAFSFTSSVINISLIVYFFLSIIIFIFSYQFAALIAPGFSPAELHLMSNLMRIIQLAQIFFVLGTIITALLQSFQHFFIPGIASAFYNLGIIIGVILLAHNFGIYGATVGVVIGAIFFCIVQVPLMIQTGYRFKLKIMITDEVKKLLHLMIPRSLALIVTQLAVLASVAFASLISARSLVIFDLAQTLMLAPVLLFGQSIAQASFPALSLKKDNKAEFAEIFTSSFNQILYLTLPVSALLIVLRIPVVRLFYGAERFDWNATTETGLTLAMFAISIGAQSLIYLFSRVFYAVKDSKTPLIITIICVGLYLVAGYICIRIYDMPIWILALLFSISSILNVALLALFSFKIVQIPKLSMSITVIKITIATFMMGIALYIPIKLLDQLVIDTTRTIGLIVLTGIASTLGFLAYLFFTWLLNIQEAYFIFDVIKKFSSRKKILKQMPEVIGQSSKQNP